MERREKERRAGGRGNRLTGRETGRLRGGSEGGRKKRNVAKEERRDGDSERSLKTSASESEKQRLREGNGKISEKKWTESDKEKSFVRPKDFEKI